jgi:hypothetical protein
MRRAPIDLVPRRDCRSSKARTDPDFPQVDSWPGNDSLIMHGRYFFAVIVNPVPHPAFAAEKNRL